MVKLRIEKGQEFKLNISESIEEDNIFYDEYQYAALVLDEMLSGGQGNQETGMYQERNPGNMVPGQGRQPGNHTNAFYEQKLEYENNIIAFCGERGEGKSSAMLTFARCLWTYSPPRGDGAETFFDKYKNIRSCRFMKPIVVDPSLFDDAHGILDIVLAELYKAFSDEYKNRAARYSNNDMQYEIEKIQSQFQKVYREISLIKNQKKALDDEYDYEGDIGKLSRLGESTHLRYDLNDLLDSLLAYMLPHNRYQDGKILLAIDDLDLCCASAYKMAEDIRKYLIIPNVVIIMAVKIQQLANCIRENNLGYFRLNISNPPAEEKGGRQFIREIDNMVERYIVKLIPYARRVYMPKVHVMKEVEIVYNNEPISGIKGSLTQDVLNLIQQKTGMIFVAEEEGYSHLIPDNLRDIVNLIAILLRMDDPADDAQYIQNIRQIRPAFDGYFAEVFTVISVGNELDCNPVLLNANARFFLEAKYEKTDKKDKLMLSNILPENDYAYFPIMGRFVTFKYRTYDLGVRQLVYKLRTFYTFRLNELMHYRNIFEFSNVFNEYIWGDMFANVMPSSLKTGVDRCRFYINTVEAYNIILKCIHGSAKDEIVADGEGNSFRIPRIKEGQDSDKIIKSWFLTALLSNPVEWTNSYQIKLVSRRVLLYNNSMVNTFISISMENFFVGMCNLEAVFNKVNMQVLGVSNEEIGTMLQSISELNERAVWFCRTIASNVDICEGLIAYCTVMHEYKGSSEDEKDLSKKAAEHFLNNVVTYMRSKNVGISREELQNIKLSENETVDICELYACLMNNLIAAQQVNQGSKEADMAHELRVRMTTAMDGTPKGFFSVSSYLKNTTADNAKANIERLAWNIQKYYSENKGRLPDGVDIDRICDFYEKVVRIYNTDKKINLSEELRNEYVQIARMNTYVNSGIVQK